MHNRHPPPPPPRPHAPTPSRPLCLLQRNIVLKQFRGIPMADLEMVMPEKKVSWQAGRLPRLLTTACMALHAPVHGAGRGVWHSSFTGSAPHWGSRNQVPFAPCCLPPCLPRLPACLTRLPARPPCLPPLQVFVPPKVFVEMAVTLIGGLAAMFSGGVGGAYAQIHVVLNGV